jgi:hypothetical protein
VKITHAWAVDTAERVAATFAVVFVMTWLAPVITALFNGGDVPTAIHGVLVTSVAWKAVLAAFAAAGTVVKAALAPMLRARKSRLSPASLLGAVQPEQAIEGAPPSPRRDAGYGVVELLVGAVVLVLLVWLVVGLVRVH